MPLKAKLPFSCNAGEMELRLPQSWERFLNSDLNLTQFYTQLDHFLEQFTEVFPERDKIFNVFYLVPPEKVRCVLYGEDPYPRKTSANGIAFWDAEIKSWQDKTVGNSMKNILKALLIAHGLATYHTPIKQCRQIAIEQKIKSPADLFQHWLKMGVLLVNVALTFSSNKEKRLHLQFWQPFHYALIQSLAQLKPKPYFILWGKKAQSFEAQILKQHQQPERIIKNGHPTFIHQFLNPAQPDYSPFIEIEKKTGFSWL